jgi:hypothetical protein
LLGRLLGRLLGPDQPIARHEEVVTSGASHRPMIDWTIRRRERLAPVEHGVEQATR